jgi:hypothetical protein
MRLDIHRLLGHAGGDGRGGRRKQLPGLEDVAHERVVAGRDLAHQAVGGQLLEAAQGQHTVQVLVAEAGVDVEMVDADVGLGGAKGDGSPALVAPPGIAALQLLVEGGLVVAGDAGAGDQRDPTLTQRLGQRSPGDLGGWGVVLDPGPDQLAGRPVHEGMGPHPPGQLLGVGRLPVDQRLGHRGLPVGSWCCTVMIDFPQGRAVASRRPGSRVPCSRGQTPEGGPIQLVGWSAAGCTGLCGHPRSRQPRRHLLTTYLPVVLRTTQRSWAQALVEELQDPVQGGPGGVAWLIHQVDSRHGIGSGGDAPWVAG